MYNVMGSLLKADGTTIQKGSTVTKAELGDDKAIERLLSRGWIEEIKRKFKPAEKPLEPSEVNSNG
jgi:hypothetical protein